MRDGGRVGHFVGIGSETAAGRCNAMLSGSVVEFDELLAEHLESRLTRLGFDPPGPLSVHDDDFSSIGFHPHSDDLAANDPEAGILAPGVQVLMTDDRNLLLE